MTVVYLIATLLVAGLHFFVRDGRISRIISVSSLGILWGYAYYAYISLGRTDNSFFHFDELSVVMIALIAIVVTASFLHAGIMEKVPIGTSGEVSDEKRRRALSIYHGAMTVIAVAMCLAASSTHIALTWVFIEITTLCASAFTLYRREPDAVEATWKYVFSCSISLVFVYVGIMFFSISAGGIGEEVELTVDWLAVHASELDPFWVKMGFVFIFVGYTAKMSLVPMFNAGIDAKDEAPCPASAILSSILMNAGFVAFYRVYKVVEQTEVEAWADKVLMATGLISLFVAAVYLTRVDNIKRLFAYSSVEHMAVVIIGISVGGIGTKAAILHLMAHTLVKAALFFHSGRLYEAYGTKRISAMGDYIHKTNGGVLMLIMMLCITAMPPSGMFFTEFVIFKAMIDAGEWVALGAMMLLLTIIVWAIGRDLLGIIFLPAKNAEEGVVVETKSIPRKERLTQWGMILMSVGVGLLIFM